VSKPINKRERRNVVKAWFASLSEERQMVVVGIGILIVCAFIWWNGESADQRWDRLYKACVAVEVVDHKRHDLRRIEDECSTESDLDMIKRDNADNTPRV